MSNCASVAYLVERPTWETQAEQCPDAVVTFESKLGQPHPCLRRGIGVGVKGSREVTQ